MSNKNSLIENPIPKPEHPELWREQYQEINTNFTDEKKGLFLWHLSKKGMKSAASDYAEVSHQLTEQTCKEDPEFAELVDKSLKKYSEWLQDQARSQFIAGVDSYELHHGEIVTDEQGNPIMKKTFPSNPMMQMELKRVNPEFREKTEIDLNIKAGVLVAPAAASVEDWISQNAKNILDVVGEEKKDG